MPLKSLRWNVVDEQQLSARIVIHSRRQGEERQLHQWSAENRFARTAISSHALNIAIASATVIEIEVIIVADQVVIAREIVNVSGKESEIEIGIERGTEVDQARSRIVDIKVAAHLIKRTEGANLETIAMNS